MEVLMPMIGIILWYDDDVVFDMIYDIVGSTWLFPDSTFDVMTNPHFIHHGHSDLTLFWKFVDTLPDVPLHYSVIRVIPHYLVGILLWYIMPLSIYIVMMVY